MNIFNSDLYKLKKSGAFWTCLVLSAAYAIIMVLMLSAYNDTATAPDAYGFIYATPILPMLIGIFSSNFVADEFGFGTIKNYLSKGALRTNLVLSKLLACFFGTTIIFAVANITVFFAGTAILGGGTIPLAEIISSVLTAYILFIAYTSLFVALSFIIRNSGIAIATNIAILIFIPTFLSVIDFSAPENATALSPYWLTGSIDKVTILPLESGVLSFGIVVALAYIAIFSVVALFTFKKSDVK